MKKQYKRQDIQLKKIVTMMRAIYMLQSIAVIVVLVVSGIRYLVNGDVPTSQSILVLLLVMTVMVLFNGYFIVRDTHVFQRLNSQMEIKNESYKNIESLNLELRSQRHDFLNHIQILYTLIELESYEDASVYLNRLYGDVGRLSANIKTSSVAMNALLQAKSNEAEARGIAYDVHINSRLEAMNMPDWELCRVVGNMIDNGLRAACEVERDGLVEIYIEEQIKTYELTVINSSLPIKPESIKAFFTPGYTTKKEAENHGMGLYISKELMKKFGNHMDMSYESGQVKTLLTIEKKLGDKP